MFRADKVLRCVQKMKRGYISYSSGDPSQWFATCCTSTYGLILLHRLASDGCEGILGSIVDPVHASRTNPIRTPYHRAPCHCGHELAITHIYHWALKTLVAQLEPNCVLKQRFSFSSRSVITDAGRNKRTICQHTCRLLRARSAFQA
jgi:hypothetical protein